MLFNQKKMYAIITAALVSGAMLATTAVGAVNNVSGYERFKDAAFKLVGTENFTLDGKATVTVDDSETAKVDFLSKRNGNDLSLTEKITIGEKDYTTEEYLVGDQIITKSFNSDKYDRSGRHRDLDESFDLSAKKQRLIQLVLDSLVGDTKNYFTMSGNEITLDLKNNQIPELAQLMTSIVFENQGNSGDNTAITMTIDDQGNVTQQEVEIQRLQTTMKDIFKAQNNVQISQTAMKATLDDDSNLKSMVETMTISGEDENGKPVTITVDFVLNVSDIGSTAIAAPAQN